jgi:hypothetical protein
MNTDQKLSSDEFGSGFCSHVISCSFEKISGNHGWHGFPKASSRIDDAPAGRKNTDGQDA